MRWIKEMVKERKKENFNPPTYIYLNPMGFDLSPISISAIPLFASLSPPCLLFD
jgi:hypothetical protein